MHSADDRLQKVWPVATIWNRNHRKASTASKKQSRDLTFSPPKVLNEYSTADACRNVYKAKDELSEVDIHAKTANIEADSIVHQTCSKPRNKSEDTW